jgi:hypothetical protein
MWHEVGPPKPQPRRTAARRLDVELEPDELGDAF